MWIKFRLHTNIFIIALWAIKWTAVLLVFIPIVYQRKRCILCTVYFESDEVSIVVGQVPITANVFKGLFCALYVYELCSKNKVNNFITNKSVQWLRLWTVVS